MSALRPLRLRISRAAAPRRGKADIGVLPGTGAVSDASRFQAPRPGSGRAASRVRILHPSRAARGARSARRPRAPARSRPAGRGSVSPLRCIIFSTLRYDFSLPLSLSLSPSPSTPLSLSPSPPPPPPPLSPSLLLPSSRRRASSIRVVWRGGAPAASARPFRVISRSESLPLYPASTPSPPPSSYFLALSLSFSLLYPPYPPCPPPLSRSLAIFRLPRILASLPRLSPPLPSKNTTCPAPTASHTKTPSSMWSRP